MKNKKGRALQRNEQHFKLKSIAIADLCGSGIAAILLFSFSFLFSVKDLPLELFLPISVVILLVGCIVSGFICARIMNQQGMLWGGICASMLFIGLLFSSFLYPEPVLGMGALSKALMMITAGMIGGIFGVNYRR
ncbi:MAG: TIGR04086 family membrane protein [Oscillospiraceae bacterium]|nr:TIGR04086 family membrane protein [Oscillospiraceae bacterium]